MTRNVDKIHTLKGREKQTKTFLLISQKWPIVGRNRSQDYLCLWLTSSFKTAISFVIYNQSATHL